MVVDGNWTVERHLAGKPAHIVDLYRQVIALAEGCGPFTYRVTATAITLRGERRGFAGLTPRQRVLSGYLDLQRRVEDDPRIGAVTPYTQRLFVHSYRIERPEQFDDGFAALLAEAYAVGNGAHLRADGDRGGRS
ncbi:DUF5655 domain-containing protein [Nitriliruptor alkaliphilus]|uniref:DUF5655 domain-containing protein n=1 Tax=Nitriliruptor alkaliphilus TaxID=427918 RepID=UPI000696155C|nr:DUF5655 domain-containing protein [Nitriliruptor alkaliphilus]